LSQTITFSLDGTFLCPKHQVFVTWFCDECFKEQQAKGNKVLANYLTLSRKMNMAIVFGVFKCGRGLSEGLQEGDATMIPEGKTEYRITRRGQREGEVLIHKHPKFCEQIVKMTDNLKRTNKIIVLLMLVEHDMDCKGCEE
jgi:hypothetical protein